jgi:hypothetical protein
VDVNQMMMRSVLVNLADGIQQDSILEVIPKQMIIGAEQPDPRCSSQANNMLIVRFANLALFNQRRFLLHFRIVYRSQIAYSVEFINNTSIFGHFPILVHQLSSPNSNDFAFAERT